MTTPSEAEQLIFNHWLANWIVNGQPRTETNFEEELIPAGLSIGEDSWVYLYVQEIPRGRQQETLGIPTRRRFIQSSQIQIAIFTPQAAGTKAATDLAQEARTVFEGIQLSPLFNFIGADIVRVGPRPPEFQINVIQPFQYQETK
jgi:hypothetical protein